MKIPQLDPRFDPDASIPEHVFPTNHPLRKSIRKSMLGARYQPILIAAGIHAMSNSGLRHRITISTSGFFAQPSISARSLLAGHLPRHQDFCSDSDPTAFTAGCCLEITALTTRGSLFVTVFANAESHRIEARIYKLDSKARLDDAGRPLPPTRETDSERDQLLDSCELEASPASPHDQFENLANWIREQLKSPAGG